MLASAIRGTIAVVKLTAEQRDWVSKMQPLWRAARRIVKAHPHLDVTDVFHALRNLRRSPSERLRRALRHA